MKGGGLPRVPVRVALALVAADVAATLTVLAWAGGWFTGLPYGVGVADSMAFAAWVVGPVVTMGLWVGVTARWLRGGLGAAGIGAVLLTALTGVALMMFLTSDSSTAALMFLSLPVLQWILVLLTVLAAAVAAAG